MLAEAAHDSAEGPFADFTLTETQRYEVHLAAWLHDCGKVTMPEYVVDKATKLETIYDRLHEIRTRFEVLRRDAEITCLKGQLAGGDAVALQNAFDARCQELEEQFTFIATCNEGGEFFDPNKVAQLKEIGAHTWTRHFDRTIGLSWEEGKRCQGALPSPAVERLLDDRPDHRNGRYNLGELYNLSISRGTLTNEERKTINDHITLTIEMLEKLPFPKHSRNVPEFAGAHHEKMDETGYPRGLRREQMSTPARIMAIADIFKVLTAADRLYKKPRTISEAIRVMAFMKKDSHIDPDLFDLFLTSGIYKDYAEQYLRKD